MTLGGAWRGLTRGDRFVLGVALLLAVACFALPQALFLVHPGADNQARFNAAVEAQGNLTAASLWQDARGQTFSPGYPWGGSWNKAGAEVEVGIARPDLARDRWGEPWHIVVTEVPDLGRCARYYSAGPDRIFEQGAGDDLRVGPGAPKRSHFRSTWWPLCWLAGLLAVPYASGRAALLPRSRSTRTELRRASVMALAPIGIVWLFGDPPGFTGGLTWLLVSPEVATLVTTSLFVWGACVACRLRPVPAEDLA